jgi:hypothetical protein
MSLPRGCRSIGFATGHTWFGEFLLLIGRIVAAVSFLSHCGSGMDSISSPGAFGNLPSFQSRLACSILALELETNASLFSLALQNLPAWKNGKINCVVGMPYPPLLEVGYLYRNVISKVRRARQIWSLSIQTIRRQHL